MLNRLRAIGVVLVLVAGGGFWIWDKVNGNDSENDKAGGIGDCLAVEDAVLLNDDAEKVDCDDATAAYVITGEGETESACDKTESYYESKDDGENWVSCLWPNVEEGDCTTARYVKVDCKASDASLEVKLVDDESADESRCPTGKNGATEFLSNAKRERLVCFGPVAA